MPDLEPWQSLILGVGGLLGTIATAIATFFLWRVTLVLAKETTRMAEASAQPHVVATLAPNRWSLRHFDLVVENTGNATAYDIHIAFNPPLENGEARREDAKIPFEQVSVLKPGQELRSYLADINVLDGKSFEVTVSWRHGRKDKPRETNVYTLSMADYTGASELGRDPMIDLARSLEKVEKSLGSMVRSKRLKIDVYTSGDRKQERQKILAELDRLEARRLSVRGAQQSSDDAAPGIDS